MRVKGLNFIPSTINFSDLTPNWEGYALDQQENNQSIDKEMILLKYLSTLSSDKERCVFLLEVLREYGYQLDYGSIASGLNIKLRWLMRIKAQVKQKVLKITING